MVRGWYRQARQGEDDSMLIEGLDAKDKSSSRGSKRSI